MFEDPVKEHEWLKGLIGDWTFEGECVMEPGQPPNIMRGTETVRAVGDRWVICESRIPMPDGGSATNVMCLGFDPAIGTFVGTFMSSGINRLWIYEGERDATGTVLTLRTEGPSLMEERTARYEDIVELTPAGERRFSSRMEMSDGTWVGFMSTTYRKAV